MAEFIHLDAAAKLAGKSEVTVRRLVKAGKVTAKKEKTHTGFIYLVDPEEVKAYYGVRGSLKLGSDPEPRAEIEPDPEPAKSERAEEEPPSKHAVATQGRVRVAVSGIEGDPVEYWVKRAETYEDRYHREVQNTAHLREELGLWKGRAEHAQALLMKLLPGPGTALISEKRNVPEQTMTVRRLTFAGMMVLIALPTVLIIGAGLVYFLVLKK
jgi:hypothetical protein